MKSMQPKTLSMIKMEKNFVAVIEKKYPRQPYETYNLSELRVRLLEEMNELNDALKDMSFQSNLREARIQNAKLECADVSNLIDYIFERLVQLEES